MVSKTRYCYKNITKRVVGEILNHIKDERFELIYKKIDSTLRGNIITELETFIKFFNLKTIDFIPAQPLFNRYIINGKLYVGDKPLDKTHYFNEKKSVTTSILKNFLGGLNKICKFYDVKTMDDFKIPEKFFAGSSILAYKLRKIEYADMKFSKILIINGSKNPVSIKQIEKIKHLYKTVEERNSKNHMDKLMKKAIMEFNRINPELTILVGGETSQNFLKMLNIDVLNGSGVIMDGIYLFKNRNRYFIFKPGGFGDENLLERCIKKITRLR